MGFYLFNRIGCWSHILTYVSRWIIKFTTGDLDHQHVWLGVRVFVFFRSSVEIASIQRYSLSSFYFSSPHWCDFRKPRKKERYESLSNLPKACAWNSISFLYFSFVLCSFVTFPSKIKAREREIKILGYLKVLKSCTFSKFRNFRECYFTVQACDIEIRKRRWGPPLVHICVVG